jgi:hypothetical protein
MPNAYAAGVDVKNQRIISKAAHEKRTKTPTTF